MAHRNIALLYSALVNCYFTTKKRKFSDSNCTFHLPKNMHMKTSSRFALHSMATVGHNETEPTSRHNTIGRPLPQGWMKISQSANGLLIVFAKCLGTNKCRGAEFQPRLRTGHAGAHKTCCTQSSPGRRRDSGEPIIHPRKDQHFCKNLSNYFVGIKLFFSRNGQTWTDNITQPKILHSNF